MSIYQPTASAIKSVQRISCDFAGSSPRTFSFTAVTLAKTQFKIVDTPISMDGSAIAEQLRFTAFNTTSVTMTATASFTSCVFTLEITEFN